MPGFFTIIDNTKKTKKQFNESGFHKSITVDTHNYTIDSYSDSIKKFENDKLFYNDDKHIIVVEGVVFNITELNEKYNKGTCLETVREMYSHDNDSFYREFRGSYSGFIYDKIKNTWTIFTNPIGDKQVFYYQDKNVILFGSEIKHFLSFFKQNNINYSLDVSAAYMLLSYGYFIGNYTLFREIRKLNAGHYIDIDNQKINIKQYHQFANEPNLSLSESEMIEGIDIYFRQAIKRQFEKDNEYSYRHIASLSAGLDSRMTNWVAYDMGFRNVLNYTFSQSEYLAQTVSQQIAADLGNELIFKTLDGGVFLKNKLEEVVSINYGAALYYSLAHGKSCIDLINFEDFGINHSGLIGGELLSAQGDRKGSGLYSQKHLNKITQISDKEKRHFDTHELFFIYNRLFNFSVQGLLPIFPKAESFSPFYDFDFITFCLTIPSEYRKDYNIYHKWIFKKYPLAANYVWDKIGTKLNSKTIKIKGRDFYFPQLKKAAKYRFDKYLLGKQPNATDNKFHMNPLDYWYKTNPDLKQFMDNYYKDNISRLDSFPELKSDVVTHYEAGNNVEKNQVLTLLAAMKLFF